MNNRSIDSRDAAQSPSIERIAAMTAALASFSLAMSFAYDWGYFSRLGISFAEAPTALSDHLRTWLVWLPITVPGLLLALAMAVYFGRLRSKMDNDDLRTLSKRILRFQTWFGPALLVVWLVIGHGVFLMLGSILCWMSTMTWTIRHSDLRQIYPRHFLVLAGVGPTLMAMFYWVGYESAAPVSPRAKAEIKTRYTEVREDDNLLFEEFDVLRTFQEWVLLRDTVGTVRWIKNTQVDRIVLSEHGGSGFPGILCSVFDVCRVSTQHTVPMHREGDAVLTGLGAREMEREN